MKKYEPAIAAVSTCNATFEQICYVAEYTRALARSDDACDCDPWLEGYELHACYVAQADMLAKLGTIAYGKPMSANAIRKIPRKPNARWFGTILDLRHRLSAHDIEGALELQDRANNFAAHCKKGIGETYVIPMAGLWALVKTMQVRTACSMMFLFPSGEEVYIGTQWLKRARLALPKGTQCILDKNGLHFRWESRCRGITKNGGLNRKSDRRADSSLSITLWRAEQDGKVAA